MNNNLTNRKSPRLKNWDYSSPGYYFVTTVTKDRILLFGNIENGKMILNEFGKIALEEWNKSFEIRKELSCDEFIIMPNHIHAILIIESDFRFRTDERPFVPTDKSIPTGMGKSISSFFAGYKSVVTKRINELRNTPKQPVWQSRFHDRIIRDEKELYNIRNYIMNNPINWNEDDYSRNGIYDVGTDVIHNVGTDVKRRRDRRLSVPT